MTLFDYLRKECTKCTIRRQHFDFKEIYNLFNEHKSIGKYLFKESNGYLFITNSSGMLSYNPKSYDNELISYVNSNTKLPGSERSLALSEFIYFITELYNDSLDNTVIDLNNSKLYKLLNTYMDKSLVDKYIDDDYTTYFEDLIFEFEDKNSDYKDLTEIFEYNNGQATIYTDYPSDEAMVYHMFLLSLVYYNYKLIENPKLQKKCPVCKNIYFTKGVRCTRCANEYANHRRKYNAKCKRRRDELKHLIFLAKTSSSSSSMCYRAEDFLNETDPSHFDLKKLDFYINELKNELDK